MKGFIARGRNGSIEEEFSEFIRRLDVHPDENKKNYTLTDILFILEKEKIDPEVIIINGGVYFKDMIRGWIPDETKIVLKCERSIKEAKEMGLYEERVNV